VLLLTPTLGGCFQSTIKAARALPDKAPRECQRLAKKVPDPGAKRGDDLGDIAVRYKAAWAKGNHRIGAIASCEQRQADAIDRGAP
jgi:hypothetical protein